jgi:hypothetical protein
LREILFGHSSSRKSTEERLSEACVPLLNRERERTKIATNRTRQKTTGRLCVETEQTQSIKFAMSAFRSLVHAALLLPTAAGLAVDEILGGSLPNITAKPCWKMFSGYLPTGSRGTQLY